MNSSMAYILDTSCMNWNWNCGSVGVECLFRLLLTIPWCNCLVGITTSTEGDARHDTIKYTKHSKCSYIYRFDIPEYMLIDNAAYNK